MKRRLKARGGKFSQILEHSPQREKIPYRPTINMHDPVLLHEGFGNVAAAPGTVAEVQNVIATNRGSVKYIDLYPFIFGTFPNVFAEDVPCTLSAGGQILLENFNLGIWNYTTQLGKDKRQRIRVILNEAQTFTSRIDNTNGTTIQAYAPQLYYTNSDYEKFVKSRAAQLKWGLGLKRKVYRLEVPDGLTAADIDINEILPRQNGNIIALGVHSSNAGTDLRQVFYDVSIDGIEIIKNVIGLHASNESGRDRFRGFGNTSALGEPVVLYITFFFEN